MNAFSVPRSILYGNGSLEELGKLEGKRATIVTGGSSMKKFGYIQKAIDMLAKAGIESNVVEDVEPNPSVETVWRGAKAMIDFKPDWIVALGGGSALDAAKIMWCFYEHPELTFEDIVPVGSMPKLRNKAKFIALPSTSGTASEITAFSVITDTKNHIKYPIVSGEIVPDIAILDPALPSTMPPHITANTGMDVFCHALESYVSIAGTEFTKPYSVEAIKLVMKYLPIAYKDGKNEEARERMHNASAIAGMAFSNASLGIVHSMAHKLGGEFNTTHGLTNAILMPYIIDFNRQFTNAYDELEKELGVDNIADVVRELNKSLDIPATFAEITEVNITKKAFEKVLDRMSKNAKDDPCTLTNPVQPTSDQIKDIYASSYFGNK